MATDPRLVNVTPAQREAFRETLLQEADRILEAMTPRERAEHLVRLTGMIQGQAVRAVRYATMARSWRLAAYRWRATALACMAFSAGGLLATIARIQGWWPW